jgi:hypothetical protein
VQSVCLQLQVCGIRVGKLGVEQVIVIQILAHYPAHFDIVPLPGELHHHPLADMSARQGGLPTAQVSDEWRGHNRRVQENDPSVHAGTDAFRKAGRQRRYRETIMVTTLAPCWYCSGLVRQFRIGAVIVGESVNLAGGLA